MPTTSNFGWTTPADTDLVKDGAAAIRTLGNGVDASFVDLKGRTTGQVLSKASNTDLDYSWVTPNVGDITEVQAGTGISVASGTGPIPVVTNTVATAYDAKGDLIVGTGADTFAKLTVGTNGYTLVANSSTSTGLEWQAPAGGGKVLQVVQATYSTTVTTSSDSFADTGLTASITPSSTNSKVLVLVAQNGVYKDSNTAANALNFRLLRGATNISDFGTNIGFTNTAIANYPGTVGTNYLDSPATTSSTTYKTQFARASGGSPAGGVQQNSMMSTITLLEIGA
jgi:hypothetical protein